MKLLQKCNCLDSVTTDDKKYDKKNLKKHRNSKRYFPETKQNVKTGKYL